MYFIIFITSYREDCLMCFPSNQVITSDTISFLALTMLSEGYTKTRMRHFTRNRTDQCRNGSSNLLAPYREQPRSTRIVVAYPRPALSATKRTITHQSILVNNPNFLEATRHAEIKKIEIPGSMVAEALSW